MKLYQVPFTLTAVTNVYVSNPVGLAQVGVGVRVVVNVGVFVKVNVGVLVEVIVGVVVRVVVNVGVGVNVGHS